MLATYLPLPLLTLLGDVPVASPAPVPATFDVSTLPHWLQVVLALLGAVVPVASLVSSYLNRYVRAKDEAGEPVAPWLRAWVVVPVNVASLNLDKAHQQAQAAKAPEVKP